MEVELVESPHYNHPDIQRRVRLIEYMSTVDFYRLERWPKMWQTMYLDFNKNNDQRYMLFSFFTNNGMDPELAKTCVLMYDYDGVRQRPLFPIRAKPHRHLNQMIEDANKGTFRNYPSIIFETKRVQKNP